MRLGASATVASWRLVVLWYVTLYAGAGYAAVVITAAFLAGRPLPTDMRIGLAITALILIALALLWRRYLFLPSDFVALIRDEGGVVVDRRWWRSEIKARRRDIWIIARLDRGLGYGPYGQWVHDTEEDRRPRWAAIGERWRRVRRVMRRGIFGREYSGEYMPPRGRVSLFRLGHLRNVSRLRVEITRDAIPETGDPYLAPALRQAAAALSDPGTSVTVEAAVSWLRVDVRGGAWLGVLFGRRIAEAMAFMDGLTRATDDHFIALDPARWTVEAREDVFVVRAAAPTRAG